MTKRTRKCVLLALACVLTLLALAVVAKGPAIFQRGNPVPYLMAAAQISEDEPCVHVGVEDGRDIYISDAELSDGLLDGMAEEVGGEFIEQAGAGYFFEDGEERIVVTTEVYWGRWFVWEVSS